MKIHARVVEISFPEKRRKSLSISLRKWAKKREYGVARANCTVRCAIE